jgi:peptidoglycan/xylan/chitin deacetylase (PgdA/CDA1 family)
MAKAASTTLTRAILTGLHVTGAARLVAPLTQGLGVVFMLHRVTPEVPPAFAPNRILTVTPDFLDATIRHVLALGYDVVSLDEAHRRLTGGVGARPFACFTFDDGYRDNRDHALPIFRRHDLPFAIYIPTDYPDGRGDLWWLALEEAIRRLDVVAIDMDGDRRRLPAATDEEKTVAFETVYWWLRTLDERRLRRIVAGLCRAANFDASALCRDLILTWPEIREMAEREPRVTFGAHTKGHWAVAKLPSETAREEIVGSKARLERELQRPCRHFCFPYGDETSAGERDFALAADAGLVTAMTTRKGLIHARHRDQLTGLPRLSLNGDYQDIGCVDALLSGLPFALLRMAERMRRATRSSLRGQASSRAASAAE